MTTLLSDLERELEPLMARCAVESGHPGYPRWDSKRCGVIRAIEQLRPLTPREILHCHGYAAWKRAKKQSQL